MPPPGRPPQQIAASSTHAEPYYSDEDIDVLHTIVTQAEDLLPTEPLATNALFSAYYSVLAQFKVNPDHDNRYARVLFKIGGLRGPGTLFQKFEEVLSRMGIDINFDQEEGAASHTEGTAISELNVETPEDSAYQPRTRARRNSESSAWDISARTPPGQRMRSNSFSDAAKATAQYDRRQATLDDRFQSSPQPIPPAAVQQDETLQRNVGAWLASAPAPAARRRRHGSLSDDHGLRIRRESGSSANETPIGPFVHTSDDFEAPSDTTAAVSRFNGDTAEQTGLVSQTRPNLSSEGVMENKATIFYENYTKSTITRLYLRAWKERTSQQREDNFGLNLIAEDHDKKALFSSAWATWHTQALEKHAITETDRFFAHLEDRAMRARNLLLYHIAFTHWVKVTGLHTQRNAVARRHILRYQVFNAWREITVVKQLKVRRHILKKFFHLWRNNHEHVNSIKVSAVQIYVGELVKKVFQAWVQKRWELRASAWWAEGVKRRTLFSWIALSHNDWQNNQIAEVHYQQQVRVGNLRKWSWETSSRSMKEVQGEVHYRDKLRRNALRKWCREAGVIPAKLALESDVALRQLRDAFAVWLHRTREERRATAIDRSKILREAWVNWRFKARARLLNAHINTRLEQQTIYKLNMAARYGFHERLWREARLQSAMHAWVLKSRAARERRLEQETVAHALLARKTQIQALRSWYHSMESLQQLEVAAAQFRDSRLLRQVLSQLSTKMHHLHQLQQWSHDADFYFRASKTLKQWKSSTEAAKREKRKAAYGQVRRTTKMNLVRSLLLKWCDQAREVLDLESRAAVVSQNRNIIVGMNIFDLWRGRAEEVRELEVLWRGVLSKKHMATWRDRFNARQALEIEAIMTYRESQESKALKKWSMSALQIRAHTNYAADIREKNAKRSFRKIYSYWHQRTMQARPLAGYGESEELGGTTRAEEWSELGDDVPSSRWAQKLDQSAPVPGYLNTPSKRAERVSAVAAKYSSTTPRAPVSTPFERHLRGRWSGGLLPSHRKTGHGRSGLSMGEFADVPEHSVKKDNNRH